MLHVYSCLTGQHDLGLVFLAILICTAACSTSMKLFIRANTEKDWALSWLFATATVFGGGVWATQVIEESAYKPGFPISCGTGLTALSLLAAIGTAWLGMFVAHRYAALARGGALIGAGIATMRTISGWPRCERPPTGNWTQTMSWRRSQSARPSPPLRYISRHGDQSCEATSWPWCCSS